MQNKSYLKCINPKCGKEYPITSTEFICVCNNLLDVKYRKIPLGRTWANKLRKLFFQRRNPEGSIFNESGVWRFRELLNFCDIDTEDLVQ